jgi:tetratricopeptide (TPR) repeat protein
MASQQQAVQEQLKQAVALQSTGRLAEAEELYRRILVSRPDLAEAKVRCAIVLMARGKRQEAQTLLLRARADHPQDPAASYHLGNLFSMQGNLDEAISAYRQAVTLHANHAAYNNLGNALFMLGRMPEAEDAYLRALSIHPELAPAHNNLGLIWLRGNLLDKARASFERALKEAPGYAEAQNNLGITLQKMGQLDEAVAAFRRATTLAPNFANAFLNLSTCLCEKGETAEAEKTARMALRLAPSEPDIHAALGNALRAQRQLAQAEASYRQALQLKPGFAEGLRLLAMLLAEQGRLDESFSLFRDHARRVYGSGSAEPSAATSPKTKHDREQQAWLGNRAAPFFIAEAGRLENAVVHSPSQSAAIAETWRTRSPQLVVIDDFLTPDALAALRRFCLDSTIWQKAYEGGYLGAFPEHGFAPPMLAQIVEEMRRAYPAIIADHPLLHFWAFKYDSRLRGIAKHADFAAVNVNFWITPDDANMDPEHGGLVVWDKAAPMDWNFSRYNAGDSDIQDFLEREKARPITIPYRANRAVIFDSDLFHETDTIHFRDGYENRRINVTLLFGRRAAPDAQP